MAAPKQNQDIDSSTAFSARPSREQVFFSQSYARALAYLKYGLEQGEGFLLLTGPSGVGKRLLLDTIFANSQRARVEPYLMVTPQSDSWEQLQTAMLAATGIDMTTMAGVDHAEALRQFSLIRLHQGHTALIVIHQAERLSGLQLQRLAELELQLNREKNCCQFLLLGNENMQQQISGLDDEQLRQRIVAVARVEPFTELELQQYLNHRASRTQFADRLHWQDDTCHQIFGLTQGIPLRINLLASKILELMQADDAGVSITPDHVHRAGAELMREVSGQAAQPRAVPQSPDQSPAQLPAQSSPAQTQKSAVASSLAAEVESVAPTPGPVAAVQRPSEAVNERSVTAEGYQDIGKRPEDASGSPVLEDSSAREGSKETEKASAVLPAPETVRVELRRAPVEKRVLTLSSAKPSTTEEDTSWLDLILDVLAFYRHPSGRHHWVADESRLGDEVDALLKIASGRMRIPDRIASRQLAEVDMAEIEQACLFYITEILLAEGASHYRELGLREDASSQAVRDHYQWLTLILTQSEADLSLYGRIEKAYVTLIEPKKRRNYDVYLAQKRDAALAQIDGSDDASAEQEGSESDQGSEYLLDQVMGEQTPADQDIFVEPDDAPPVIHYDFRPQSSAFTRWFRRGMLLLVIPLSLWVLNEWGVIDLRELSREWSLQRAGLAPGGVSEPAPAPAPVPVPVDQAHPGASGDGRADASLAEDAHSKPVVAAPDTAQPALRSPPASRRSEAIAPEELDLLLEQLRSSYEAGDLEMFIELFAFDARSNGKQGQPAIRRDYMRFFRDSSDRSITFSNMQWEFGRWGARGKGRFEAEVVSRTNQHGRQFQGEVQFGARKLAGELHITSFNFRYMP